MKRILAAAAALLLGVSGVDGAALALDEAEMARAIAVGQRSTTSAAPFDAEWRVTNAAGETVIVVTPFYRLALAARHAAFKGELFTPSQRDKVLSEQKDRLPMWVSLKGTREDFARYYVPRFVVTASDGREQEIVPTFVQNERTALRQDGAFVARCIYGFATKEITGTSRGALVLRDVEGREVGRFGIDLARMR